ncbi:hypothetical protein AAMO2058_001101700 [Amorphochlora amoebiformis]
MKKFWKPGTVAPGVNIERDAKDDDAGLLIYNPRKNLSLKQQKILLPIYGSRTQILYALEKYRTVIIVGQTGSGKTTQIPQYLHEAGWTAGNRCVVCTQPRRIAAITVAKRVAAELNCTVGEEVGYSIRFDDCYDPLRTKINYVTDGMLIRQMMSDPLLTRYSVVMVDEAHERTLNTDIILGLLRKVQKKRKDLRVVISSATLDARAFKRFFDTNKNVHKPHQDTATILSVQGRCYPVDVMYAKHPVRNYLQAAVDTVIYIHTRRRPGDILVFLTGSTEIDQAYELLRSAPRELIVMRLYGGMHSKDQQRVFRPSPSSKRKVVLATNIAETSVTIEGIGYVIDTGFVKLPAYDPQAQISTLHVTPVSKAQARQRAGRAGRVRDGVCYRLYTEDTFRNLPSKTVPEIQRTRLDTMVLQLKSLGISDVVHFPFLSPPPARLLEDAVELLFACKALDRHGRLTPGIGESLAELPVNPMIARMLVAAGENGCAEQILSIAAMLCVRSPYVVPRYHRDDARAAHRALAMREGDHLTLLNIYNQFLDSGKDAEWCKENHLRYAALRRANEIRRQLRRAIKRRGIPIQELDQNSDEATVTLIKTILTAFFPNVAQLSNQGDYITVRGGQRLVPSRHSALYGSGHRWVFYHDVVETIHGRQMNEVSAIQASWVTEVAPHYYKYTGVDSERSQEHKVVEERDSNPRAKIRRLF